MPDISSGRPTLCLAMIVKNEETNLSAWLPEAVKHLDEIVIVDTGSTDGTVDLLRALPVTLLQQSWAFDFALHRNFGLDHVTSDWVLILDADERLSEADWLQLRTLLDHKGTMAYLCQVKNYHTGDVLSSFDVMFSYRLFRSGYGIKYEGSVHNQLAPAIEKACAQHGMEARQADIVVEHFGYALSKEGMQTKQARIYEMVKRQLEQTPGDPYYLYHLLNICLAMQRFDEAANTLQHLHIDALRPELRVHAWYKAAQVALYFDEHTTARDYIQQSLQLQPKAAFLYYLKSNILYQMHRFSEGLRAAYKALEYASRPMPLPDAVHVAVDECLTNIGLGYLLSNERTSAASYFREALRKNPHNAVAKEHIERISTLAVAPL